MTATIAQTVGVDISKDTLDVHLHPDGDTRQFANTARGFTTMLEWLAGRQISRIVFEPTGAYHHAFERRLGAAGLPLVKVNPLQARRFAEAIGTRAKTDAVDAAMLARFGAMAELPVRPIVSQTIDEMKELLVARRALIKDRIAASQRDQTRQSPLLKRQATQRLRQVKHQIAAIDQAMHALCLSDADLQARLAILVSIPGIGELTAMIMLIEMPELGTLENKCVASLAGLAPMARDSGQSFGKRFIRGGRAHLRQALYMPALVSVRFNKTMKEKYEAFIAAGKPPKVALTAVMRKLAILANALLRDHRSWTPSIA
jgi:transposase